MFLKDYHIHSSFSNDSDAPLKDIAKYAFDSHVNEFALTDHNESKIPGGPFKDNIYQIDKWPTKYPVWTVPKHDPPIDYGIIKKNIDELNDIYLGKMKILFGIEAGQPHSDPEDANRIINSHPFDFVLGSTHTLNNDLDLYYVDYNKCDPYLVYDEYLDQLFKLIQFGNFDVMAHVNYAGRYIWRDTKKRFDCSVFEEKFREIFKKLALAGKGIEINTSGLFQGLDETIPSLWLLKVYKECGGEIVTVGSDAHYAEHVARGIRFSYEMMKIAGFKAVATFSQRKVGFSDLK